MELLSIKKTIVKNSCRQLIAALSLIGAQFAMPSLSYSEAYNQEPLAWSKSDLQKAIQKAESAYKEKDWQQAIILGERALTACIARMSERDRRCIRIMKNNSMAYYHTGELESNAKKIEQSYRLASSQLGAMHFSTIRIREVFHELVLNQERYAEAIPLVIELIDVERKMGNDEFKILNWQIQLYALYKIEGQIKQEIPMLEKMAKLTEKLMGVESEQLGRTLTVLAETYCTQKQYYEFYELVRKYKIKQSCKS